MMPPRKPYVTERILRHTTPKVQVIGQGPKGKTTVAVAKPKLAKVSMKNPQVRVSSPRGAPGKGHR